MYTKNEQQSSNYNKALYFNYVEESDNLIISPNLINTISAIYPHNINIYNVEHNSISIYYFRYLAAILNVFVDSLFNHVTTIKFTMKDIFEKLDLACCIENYDVIKRCILHFKTHLYTPKNFSDSTSFYIISSIEEPISNNELEWTININENVIRVILQRKYNSIFNKTILDSTLNWSSLLYMILICEFE